MTGPMPDNAQVKDLRSGARRFTLFVITGAIAALFMS